MRRALGTAFKLSTSGTETVLHSFGDKSNDGQDPQAPLIIDSAGNLYGATLRGGAHDDGAIFKVATDDTETLLYSFGSGRSDGQNPGAGLVMDSAGNLSGRALKAGPRADVDRAPEGSVTISDLIMPVGQILDTGVDLHMIVDGQ